MNFQCSRAWEGKEDRKERRTSVRVRRGIAPHNITVHASSSSVLLCMSIHQSINGVCTHPPALHQKLPSMLGKRLSSRHLGFSLFCLFVVFNANHNAGRKVWMWEPKCRVRISAKNMRQREGVLKAFNLEEEEMCS